MDFINKLVIPQPDYNLELLNGLLIFALMIFLVHTGILLGSMLLSLFYKPQQYTELHKNQYLFSKELSDVITGNMTNLLGIGLVPFIAIILFYSQLLHNAEVNVVGFLLLSFILYSVGIFLIYRYKSSYGLDALFLKMKEKLQTDEDFIQIDAINKDTRKRAGFLGVVFLLLALWIFIGSISLAVDRELWDKYVSVFWLFISGEYIIKFIHFITASLAIASTTFLFVKFIWNRTDKKYDEEYNTYSRKQALRVGIIFTLFQPFLFLSNILSTPKYALNSTIFLIVLIAVIAVFLTVTFLYITAKTEKMKYLSYSFIFAILFVSLIGAKEKSAFGVSNKKQIAELDKQYEIYNEDFMASLGRTTVEVDGEEIYRRCMACHRDENTPAAPAHKNIMDKYIDNKEALVQFISNPVPVDPNYPPMPNQGLRPNEVDAVADFLIKKYGGNNEETNE